MTRCCAVVLLVAGLCGGCGGAGQGKAAGETGGAGADPTGGAGGGGGGGNGGKAGSGGATGGAAGGKAEDAAAGGSGGMVGGDAGPGPDTGPPPPAAAVSVLTHKYNNARTGWNSAEKVLTPAVVSSARFGKLFSRKVDGQLYAQPLVVAGLVVGGKTRNVVYSVTQRNNVYAFDADDPAAVEPLWMAKLGPTVPKAMICGCNDVHPEVGITATPVIDGERKTIYLTSKHLENGSFAYRLHALDIVTGMPRAGSPVVMTASVPGTGSADDLSNGMITFNARRHMNRPGLLLQNGAVHVAFASHGDQRPFHGWVLAYDAVTLQQRAVFNTTPGSWGGGIWMSGNGLAGDGTNIYFATGNGGTNPAGTPPQLGEALVKLDGNLKLVDWHMRENWAMLDMIDKDFGMSGPLLVPDSNLLLMAGNDLWAFLYDRNNLGKKADDTAPLQKFKGSGPSFSGRHGGGLVYWVGPMGPMFYGWAGESRLLGFKLGDRMVDDKPVVVGPDLLAAAYSGGTMVISSDGPQNGILWVTTTLNQDSQQKVVPGKLRAHDAVSGALLWDSTRMKERDDLGMYASYAIPVAANGKVYANSWTGSSASVSAGVLHVYGLLP